MLVVGIISLALISSILTFEVVTLLIKIIKERKK